MPRKPRLDFAGAIHHITSRGVEQRRIYLEDAHRELHLAMLGETVERFGWECHAYCQMDNHYHLLVRTPEANLACGMQYLNGAYAQAFNRLCNRSGHLFQGRFGQVLVEREAHLLAVIRYTVLNRVRARACADVADWPWSSYRATAGLGPAPAFLQTDWTLKQFHARDRIRARAAYREFVGRGPGGVSLVGVLLAEKARTGV